MLSGLRLMTRLRPCTQLAEQAGPRKSPKRSCGCARTRRRSSRVTPSRWTAAGRQNDSTMNQELRKEQTNENQNQTNAPLTDDAAHTDPRPSHRDAPAGAGSRLDAATGDGAPTNETGAGGQGD